MDEGYEGWANWDTWAAGLWLTSDEATYRRAVQLVALSTSERLLIAELIGLLDNLGNPDGVSYAKVEWGEVIASLE